MRLAHWLRKPTTKRNPGRRFRPRLEAAEYRVVPGFLAPVNSSSPYQYESTAVAVGDLNSDGNLDIVEAEVFVPSGGGFPGGRSFVRVRLGRGDGTFQFAGTAGYYGYLIGDYGATSVTLADVTGDGNLDVVAGSSGYANWINYGTISVLPGNGDGTFGVYDYVYTGLPVDSVALGDVDGDGAPDIVAGCGGWDELTGEWISRIHVQRNNGGVQEYSVFGQPSSVALTDLDGDGWLDIAAASNDDSSLNVLLNVGGGTFGGPQNYATGGSGGGSDYYEFVGAAVGDFNGDGAPDVVTTSPYGSSVNVLPGNGDGTFAEAQNYTVGDWGNSAVVADINADGTPDITTANRWGGVNVLLNDGTTFQPVLNFSAPNPESVTAGDFNADGFPDLVTTGYNGSAVPCISTMLNDGVWNGPPPRPTVSIGDVTLAEGNAGTTAFTFTVTLSAASAEPVSVDYATADGSGTAGSDYQAASGTLTFAPGETTKTITVLVNGDREYEPTETFAVNLSNPTNVFLADGQGLGTIVNDEVRAAIGDVTLVEGNTGTTSVSFVLSLSATYDAPVTVDYAMADGSATAGADYQAASGSVTFAPGETTRTVTVQVLCDRLPEPAETFVVNLTGAANATISDGQGVGTITDDEPRISVTDASRREGRKGHKTQFTFTVTLSAAYDEPVTVSYRTADGTATTGDGDYAAQAGTLTFAPGETSKTVTIIVNGDGKGEANETFYLDLFGNSSNSLLIDSRGVGMILNDD